MLGGSPGLSTPFRTFYNNRTECTQVICHGRVYQPRKVVFLLHKYTPQSIRILLVEIYYIRLCFASRIGNIFNFCSVFFRANLYYSTYYRLIMRREPKSASSAFVPVK